MDYNWAKEYSELFKICTLFNLEELSNPVRFKYIPIQGIIQEGPQCGLVALAMCSENPSKETVDNIMSRAKDLNFSNKGEIFSGKYMYELAKNNLNNKSVVLYDGLLNSDLIKQFLFEGGLALVPYDCDKNHAPVLKNGHKAHWALLIGIVEARNGTTYVLAHHGKSRNVMFWDLNELAMSNSQLNEYPEEFVNMYKIPELGLNSSEGLKNKAVLIKEN